MSDDIATIIVLILILILIIIPLFIALLQLMEINRAKRDYDRYNRDYYPYSGKWQGNGILQTSTAIMENSNQASTIDLSMNIESLFRFEWNGNTHHTNIPPIYSIEWYSNGPTNRMIEISYQFRQVNPDGSVVEGSGRAFGPIQGRRAYLTDELTQGQIILDYWDDQIEFVGLEFANPSSSVKVATSVMLHPV